MRRLRLPLPSRGRASARRKKAQNAGLGPSLPLRDLLAESSAALLARPARVALTVLGTVVGVAALVATLGLSKTASNQIVGRFDAVAAKLATGRFPDAGHSARGDRVAVLGPNAAKRLNVDRVDQRPAIFIGDRLYLVIGILASVERQPSLNGAITIPEGTAVREFGLVAPGLAQIETKVGATDLIARQAPLALSPTQASELKVAAPPNPRELRGAVRNDLNALFVLLGGVSLLVGAIGIANVTLVSVLERVGEIGLRRALGAARRHVAAQFLVESSAMGALGGIIGASLGTLVVVGISATRTWTPVLDPWIPLAAPLLGAVIGLVSGTYPALRASRMEPVDALRAGT
jgi:macrolide transport system ATP-binding/permease protein